MTLRGPILALLVLLAAALRWPAVAGPHPPGTDGYYYVVQVEDLVATGALHVPDASWVLRLLALPHALGLDPIAGVQVAAALLAAALVPAGEALGRRLGGPGGGLVLATFAAVSPTVTQLAADFPKSLGAIPLLWGALAAAGPAPTAVATTLLLGLLAATAHRLGAAALGLAAVGAAASRGAKAPRWAVGAAVGAGAVFGLLAVTLPGLLHPEDLDRVAGQLRASPWPPPPFSWLVHRQTHPAQTLELAVVPWAGLGAGIALLRDPDRRALGAALLVPLAVCLFPWWRADELDLAYRLGLLAPLLGAPLLVSVRPPPLAALALLLGAPFTARGFDRASAPPYAAQEARFARIPRPLPELLVIAPGASFHYDHVTGAEALAWAPEPELDRTKIFRVAWGIRDGEWAAYAPDAEPAPVRLDPDHVYVREDVWEGLLARAATVDDDDLHERLADPRNPTRVRPASLLRNR